MVQGDRDGGLMGVVNYNGVEYNYDSSAHKYSDITISERENWRNFIDQMQRGEYAQALSNITSSTYDFIATNALFWNTLFNYIVNTEELKDDTFKSTKIQTSSTAPADLTTGQIYFKVKS